MKPLLEKNRSKLDAFLIQWCDDAILDAAEPMPVVVRCAQGSTGQVEAYVTALGGRVRHELPLLSAFSAWIPRAAVCDLANLDAVHELEMVQAFDMT